MPKDLTGKAGREADPRPDGEGWQKDWQNMLSRDLTGKAGGKDWPRKMMREIGGEIDREDAKRLDEKGGRRGCPERLAEYAAPRLAGKGWQRGGSEACLEKVAGEDADQSAERPVPRLAGCIRPLATAQSGAATERNLDGGVKRLGRGTKEDWWKQKETW